MKRQKLTIINICLVLLLTGILVLSACSTSTTAPVTSSAATTQAPAATTTTPKAPAVELRMLTANAMTGPSGAIIQRFIDTLNNASNGEYVVKFQGGPEAMAPVDIPTAVKNGTVEMGLSLYTHIAPLSPGVFPILHSELTWAEMRASGAADYIQQLFGIAGLHHLVAQNLTPPQESLMIWGKKPINKLEDFKGLKMGNPSPVFLALWQALGVEQVLVQLNDMYEAMSRGLIDTYIISLYLVPTYKLYEVTKYGSNLMFASGTTAFYMNQNTWNKLSPTAQKNIAKAADDYDAGLVSWFKTNYLDQAITQAKNAGVQFINVSDADKKKFAETLRSAVWDAEIKKNPETATKLKSLITKP